MEQEVKTLQKELFDLKSDMSLFLFRLFEEEGKSAKSYEDIDDFYARIGYDYEAQNLLYALRIQGTSDLQELFLALEGMYC
ncbi:hypothetical protein BH739_16385 [Enterococcus casseliflavus]|nr:hypothetical protein BH739_16385 [Enterococcus casseliflavus]